MRSALPAAAALVALAVVVACSAACSGPPERLSIADRTITVYNDSGEAWNGVEIWVNDHYRVTRDSIATGERFIVPLETFVAGFGRRFDPAQHVGGIEVTATDASGDPVRLTWGNGRRQ
jgi:hypothetical protein